MLIAGVDFETTFMKEGESPKDCRIVEIGAALWDTETKSPLMMLSLLVWGEGYVYDERITNLLHVSEGQLKMFGRSPQEMLARFLNFVKLGEYLVAHNGKEFDEIVLTAECERHGLLKPEQKWLDSMTDIPYPERIKTRALEFLAPSHGFLNPFAHRALTDVLTMLRVVSEYDIQEIIRRSTSPKVRLRAITQKPWTDGGKSNQIAKEHGYRFNGDKNNPMWVKTVLADEVEAEQKKIPIQTAVIQ